jgi:ABC-type oligopeptide transport system substrate-binding subunit
MRKMRRSKGLLALVLGLALVMAACGGDDDNTASGTTAAPGDEGGELIDLATFSAAPPPHFDPALNSELDTYQVLNALYDGLTEIDFSDPANPEVKPLVAESFEPNADATEWTFKIKEGQVFSNGEAVLPSSFVRAWERATVPDFAGDYSYLFNFIKGGKEKLDGSAPTLAGVQADDEAMTLTVQMAAPYANFDAVAGFQTFFPVPKAVDELSNQAEWATGVQIGNGPYKLEKAPTDQEIVIVRNDRWGGDIFGNKRPKVDKITFKVSQDQDSAYTAFEAGEGDTAVTPTGRVKEADENYASTIDVKIIGSFHYNFDMADPVVGGEKNKLLRQAISLAFDREEINRAAYDGVRQKTTGITPPGIPGHKAGLCDYCEYDKAAAQKAFDDWKAAGNSLTEPIKIQFNTDAGQEPVVQIMVDNLAAIGIDAEQQAIPSDNYFDQLRDGACQFCRAGWYADYPTYDNFMYDLFSKESIGGNNLGPYDNAEFDRLVAEAKSETDKDAAAALYQQAEELLVNTDIGTVPLLWYVGDYVYNPDKVTNFPQTGLGLVLWEQVTVKS